MLLLFLRVIQHLGEKKNSKMKNQKCFSQIKLKTAVVGDRSQERKSREIIYKTCNLHIDGIVRIKEYTFMCIL